MEAQAVGTDARKTKGSNREEWALSAGAWVCSSDTGNVPLSDIEHAHEGHTLLRF